MKFVYFPPNVTSHYQPMDMGIIDALKKRYKYKVFKQMLYFMDLPEEEKARLDAEAARQRRGTVALEYGRYPI